MFPKPKKIWPFLVAIAAVWFVYKNPAQAADLVNHAINSGTTFLNRLG